MSKLHALSLPLLAALPWLSVQTPGADQESPHRAAVIERLKDELRTSYAFKDRAAWLVDSLTRNERLGEYAGLGTAELGAALTEDLRGWTSDKHFMVAHMPKLEEQLRAPSAATEETPEGFDDPQEVAVNYGVRRAEMLDDRVALIRLDRVAYSPNTVFAFQEALVGLPEAGALLLDLRDNHGGSAEMVPLLLSCFFDRGEQVELGTRYWRPDDRTTPIQTQPNLPGVRYYDHPILILTSRDTRSAAEALAYHLRAFGRAYVVGERTSGGAHPADMVSLGDGFVALIPMGIVTSARTGTDWEGRGVPIDVPCAAAEAQDRAHQLALRLLENAR